MPSNKNQSIKGTLQKRVPKLNFPNPPNPPPSKKKKKKTKGVKLSNSEILDMTPT